MSIDAETTIHISPIVSRFNTDQIKKACKKAELAKACKNLREEGLMAVLSVGSTARYKPDLTDKARGRLLNSYHGPDAKVSGNDHRDSTCVNPNTQVWRMFSRYGPGVKSTAISKHQFWTNSGSNVYADNALLTDKLIDPLFLPLLYTGI
ncbi:hypothetical protein J6590_088630 [Homalodisca vitripennis]|nr:hypothetical protein J6590_088630 [Homalodisca vitripennis]